MNKPVTIIPRKTSATLRAINLFALPLLSLLFCFNAAARDLPLDKIKLPPGFAISIYAEIPGARSITLGAGGTVFVATLHSGKVYAVTKDRNVHVIAEDLNTPNGVAYRNGSLYVAEISRILRYDNIDALSSPARPVVVNDKFPKDFHHGWKFIAFGPDGLLYVPVGAPCNSCEPDPDRYALISRIRPDGSGYEVFARGVRNSVGFDWEPQTGELWFTDNGRDWMGDDLPSDELNHAPKAGMNFGFPYCHQGDIPDPEFGAKHGCNEFTPPAVKLGPHVAALGMRFYTGKMFPADYRNRIFIAQHGSWNRSKKSGYRVMMVTLKNNKPVNYEVFAEGWLQGEKNWGRPVDVLVMPDGSLLISDDQAGVIYRISYQA